MSDNSSFPSNTSLPLPLYPPTSIYSHFLNCFKYTVVRHNTIAFTIAIIVTVLPFCIFVLYLGLHRWRQQRSSTTMSHSDLFTYHMVGTELMGILGFSVMSCGIHTGHAQLIMVGFYLFVHNYNEQMFYHTLTCVERYLAVVHPVTYLNLKKAKGIKIRNIAVGCGLLLSAAATSLMYVEDNVPVLILYFSIVVFALIAVTFCSLSVLRVLILPGPGEGGGHKQQVEPSKLRAFYTIMAILVTLLIRFGGAVLTRGLYASSHLEKADRCALWLSFIWFCLPSSLVLPLLFLQRARKLLCCKKHNESGQGSNKI